MYSYKEIYPEHQSYCRFPKSLDHGLNWVFCMQYQHDFPPVFVTEVPEGHVWGLDGKVTMHDGRLLGDASCGYNPSSEVMGYFSALNLPAEDYIDGTVAVLISPYSNNYYHWLFDVLPRLHLLMQSGITCDKYLVNWDGLSFQIDTLSALGIPQTKLIKNKPDIHLKARKLVVPSLANHAGYVPNWVCSFLRSKLLQVMAEPNPEFRRIYISRADAIHRRVVNEREITTLLNDFGFMTVVPGLLSFAEQVSIFNSADIVIAPHGAGLTNLLFCNSGTKVIEFFSPNYVCRHYWWIASHLDLDYYYFEGLGERPPRNVNRCLRTNDIEISLNSSDLIELYRKFMRIKEPIPKGNAANIADWQSICKVDGWLSQPAAVALQWLVRQLPVKAQVVEIGTSNRQTGIVIASALPPGGLLYYINGEGDMTNPQDVPDQCDMVFINTKSDCNSVLQAVIRWYPKLKPGGYMVFHNYGLLPGVKQAAISLDLKGDFIADGLWCHRKMDTY